MFIKIIFSYIIGYLRISVEGYYIERFINICTNKKLLIWNLKRDKNVKLYLNIGIKDFKQLSDVARKTKCKIKIKKKSGLPFILNRYKKRKIFGLFLIIISLLIVLSSNYIWNVEIKEEDGKELVNIEQDLQEAGLKIGTLKSKVNSKDIINNIRLKRQDIAWMGIELKGTNVIVKVVKTEEKPNIIDSNEYCNIVSNKTGVITKINAQKGTAMVNAGDTVKEGDVLISGTMEGKYTGTRYVHSIGNVEAKVWHTKSKKIYYNQEKLTDTGNEENKYGVKINNFEINFNKRVSKFEFYDTINAEKKFKIFSNLYLPISVTKLTYKEKEKTNIVYDVDEATNIGVEELQKEIEQEIEDKSKILRKKCK